MKKRILNKLLKVLNSIGFYTKLQYEDVEKKNREVKDELRKVKMSENSLKFYNNTLKKQIKSLPFQFDALIISYDKFKLNAFVYKAINQARNKVEMRDLLDIWASRITNAKDSLQGKETPENGLKNDKITASHFPGHH